MVYLASLSLRALRPPYPWAAEFVNQFRFTVKICFFPMILTAFALSFGPAGIQASNFFALFGALDRLGGAYELIVVRLFAPLVVGIILAGAAGTAICADLGARVVREEIDALRVLGVDPIKSLVVPRLLVLMLGRAVCSTSSRCSPAWSGWSSSRCRTAAPLGPGVLDVLLERDPARARGVGAEVRHLRRRSSRSSAATRESTSPAAPRASGARSTSRS